MRTLVIIIIVVTISAMSIVPQPVSSQGSYESNSIIPFYVNATAPRIVPNEVLVQFKANTTELERSDARQLARGGLIRRLETQTMRANAAGVLELVSVTDVTVAEAIEILEKHPAVEFAEPNWIYTHQSVSNDPYYTGGSMWNMYGDLTTPANEFGSQAGEIWESNITGSSAVYIGVIDEGIQFDHPDLAANIWTNSFDPVDGIDNDGNGFIDDTHGWDFNNNDNSTYDGGTAGSADAHGTHVAGIIGAEGGNGVGVAGVNWDVTLISAKFLGPNGGSTFDAIRALDYLTDLKTRHNLNIVATNNSYGGGGFSQAFLNAITRAANANILFVAAAGNGGVDNLGDDNDVTPYYPANYSSADAGYDNVISVAAITVNGALSSFSNFGITTVDVAAPGSGVYSTVPPNSYSAFAGTSMATPHVTGAVALYASIHPGASALTIKNAILNSTTPTASLIGHTLTGGRLNVGTLLGTLPDPSPSPTPANDAIFRDDFLGVALDNNKWASGNWVGEPISVNVANGLVTVNNHSYIRSNQTWFQKTLEGLVTLGNGAHFGFADTLSDPSAQWVIFTVNSGTTLARTRANDGQFEINTPLSGVQPDVAHLWKIVWKADNSVEFWVDNVLRASHTRTFNGPLKIFLTAAQTATADWIQVNDTSPGPTPSPPPNEIFRDDFAGTALDTSKWTTGNWVGQSVDVTVATGFVTIHNNSYVRSNQSWFQKTLEGMATLNNGSHFGLATSLNDPSAHWMIFTVNNGITIARTRLNDGQSEINTSLSGIQPGIPHLWRIVWKLDNSIEFWVDDVLKVTHTRAFPGPLSIFLSAAQSASADWVRISDSAPGPTPTPTPTPTPVPTPTPTPTPPPNDIFRDDFTGVLLDESKWASGNWSGHPVNVTVANGFVAVNNSSYIRSTQTWFQKTLEGVATLANGSHFGLANSLNDENAGWIIFTVNNGITMARTRLDDGKWEINTTIQNIQPALPHLWKIVWKTDNSVEFWVDDVLKVTHSRAFTSPLNIFLSSNQTATADFIRVIDSSPGSPAFTESLVVNGLSNPTAMAFAPDGRLFVCEQAGRLRIIKNGSLLASPFLTVNVDPAGERGLLGIAFDPGFVANQFVYIYYTTASSPVHNRVSRFTASGDVAVTGSEQIILELNNLSTATNHNGGAIHFGLDGKLYIAVGDNASGSNSQTLGNMLGKILRINADGSIPTDNPFYNATTGNNRSIWVLGLRNPFTFAIQRNSGRTFINDVGEVAWEEIDDAIAGSNYGWPTCEGVCSPPNVSFRNPIYYYANDQSTCAITGGAFYNPVTPQFPSEYVGTYFFADFCGTWIKRLNPTNNVATDFVTLPAGRFPVDIQVGPEGSLYYLSRGGGGVYRIQYSTSASSSTLLLSREREASSFYLRSGLAATM